MNTMQTETCESGGSRILEVVEYLDDVRIVKYQIIDPDDIPVGKPYLTIYHAFQFFRTLMNRPKAGLALSNFL